MNDDDQIYDNIRTSFENQITLDKIGLKIKKSVDQKLKILDKFEEIDNSVDNDTSEKPLEDDDMGLKKPRKSKRIRASNMNDALITNFKDDFEEIFMGKKKLSVDKKLELQKDDKVVFVVNKKEYYGVVFQIYSDKGLIIKTNDRKKIKLLWESIDSRNVQIYKV